ncbi:uncharacterized protein PAN0_003d1637 [Moesziomyces antarcticus]|uniref:uncharacterized protein n=1 Tax=Pseudozyma antarctica TaxID=84753 RepID=UPI00071964EC|nr:uncharacterized protein PAN0_003d1637 [Moesziomyces antarcticus]GAK63433.1 hypothetical protein PAN0_003d1637 [Moesziomyces antarcticus]
MLGSRAPAPGASSDAANGVDRDGDLHESTPPPPLSLEPDEPLSSAADAVVAPSNPSGNRVDPAFAPSSPREAARESHQPLAPRSPNGAPRDQLLAQASASCARAFAVIGGEMQEPLSTARMRRPPDPGSPVSTAALQDVVCRPHWIRPCLALASGWASRPLALHDESRHTVPAARVVQASSGALSILAGVGCAACISQLDPDFALAPSAQTLLRRCLWSSQDGFSMESPSVAPGTGGEMAQVDLAAVVPPLPRRKSKFETGEASPAADIAATSGQNLLCLREPDATTDRQPAFLPLPCGAVSARIQAKIYRDAPVASVRQPSAKRPWIGQRGNLCVMGTLPAQLTETQLEDHELRLRATASACLCSHAAKAVAGHPPLVWRLAPHSAAAPPRWNPPAPAAAIVPSCRPSSVAWSQEDPAQGLMLRTAPSFSTDARIRHHVHTTAASHSWSSVLGLSSVRCLVLGVCVSRILPDLAAHPVPLCLLAAALPPPDSCAGWCAEQLVQNVLVLCSTAPPAPSA